ncbi:MAG: chitobiase/beta-hexosaminidase C-terminal domain-containing protein [Vicinamibacterales bacterium]
MSYRTTPVAVTGVTGATAVAGGEAHSAAIVNGQVRTWGGNSYGQLGDGTTTPRTTAVVAAGPTSATSVATGQGHTAVMTTDGSVWAWGRDTWGQLGDAGTTALSTPFPVGGAGLTWGVVAPQLTPTPGAYAAPPTVGITTLTPGATVHYTTSGADPTEADPVLTAGQTVTVDHALTLKARAWKTGLAPSPIVAGALPARGGDPHDHARGGDLTTAQAVALATATPGATVRYTLNGVDPTEQSPVRDAYHRGHRPHD